MKLVKYIISMALAVSMVLSLAACSDTTWVYDYNGKKIPSGLYLAFSVGAYSNAQSQIDEEKDMFSQKIDGKDVNQWIIDSVKKQADQYMAIENKFEELKLTLTDDDNKEIEQTTKNGWAQLGTYYEQNAVSQNTYKLMVANQKKQTLIFDKYYGKGGIEEVSEETMSKYFKENYTSVNMFGMPLETGETLTDEQKKANTELKALAEDYVKKYNNKEKTINELYDMYRHYKSKDAHDPANKDDVISKDDETKSPIKKDSTSPSEKVVKSIFSDMKTDGVAKLMTDESGYYIVVRYELTDTDFDNTKTTVLANIKGKDFTKLVEDWGAALKANTNEASVKRYAPKKINLEDPTAETK